MYSLRFLFYLLCFVFETGSHVSRAASNSLCSLGWLQLLIFMLPLNIGIIGLWGVIKIGLHVCQVNGPKFPTLFLQNRQIPPHSVDHDKTPQLSHYLKLRGFAIRKETNALYSNRLQRIKVENLREDRGGTLRIPSFSMQEDLELRPVCTAQATPPSGNLNGPNLLIFKMWTRAAKDSQACFKGKPGPSKTYSK